MRKIWKQVENLPPVDIWWSLSLFLIHSTVCQSEGIADLLIILMLLLWRDNWGPLYLTQHGAVALVWRKGRMVLTHEQSGKDFSLKRKRNNPFLNAWCCQAVLPERQQGCCPDKRPAATDWWSGPYTCLNTEAGSEIYPFLKACSVRAQP